jgi:hypothetical protein
MLLGLTTRCHCPETRFHSECYWIHVAPRDRRQNNRCNTALAVVRRTDCSKISSVFYTTEQLMQLM